MKTFSKILLVTSLFFFFNTEIFANTTENALKNFRQISNTAPFFKSAYGYAIFPTVGSGGFIIGGAYGKGQVFVCGVQTGITTLKAASVGFQLGGKAFSEIIFFKDKAAYKTFTQASFAFGAKASVTVVTLGANAEAGSNGASASAGTGALGHNKKSTGAATYVNGMATFILPKGGLMYKATIDGQVFSFKPVKKKR